MALRQLPSSVMPMQPISMELYRRDSSGGDLRPIKRRRRSRPKVRSGCITCKSRRVKCDETKPHCLRCQKFGRLCDGYPELPSESSIAIVPIQPREPFVSMYDPSLSIHKTEDESRYFQFFLNHSAQELSGFFDPTFWAQLVPREAHSLPPIRHAAIAIGALRKSLENAPGPGLKVNIIQSIDKRHYEAAVCNYLKAIQALNSYITASHDPQLRTALIACLLFICFETFQGSIAASVQQVYGGLKILRHYYQGKQAPKSYKRPKSPVISSFSSTVAVPGRTGKELQARPESESASRAILMHFEDSDAKPFRPNAHTDLNTLLSADICDPNDQQFGFPEVFSRTSSRKDRSRIDTSIPAGHLHSNGIKSGNTSEGEADFIPREPYIVPAPDRLGKGSEISSTNYVDPFISIAPRTASSAFSTLSVSNRAPYTLPYSDPHTPSPFYRSSSQLPSTLGVSPTPQPLNESRNRQLTRPSRSPTPPELHNDFAIEDILIQTFVRLDGHGLFFGMAPAIQPLIWDVHKTWHLPIPTTFFDFPSAHRCWDFLMDRALQFFRRISYNRAYAQARLDPQEQIAAELESYMNQLNKFAAAFQPILDQAISGDGMVLQPAALLLSLYHRTTIITLAAIPNDSEMVYDAYLPSFKYIVHTAALIMSSHTNTQRPSAPRFTLDVGIVPPLHVVAMKCREPGLRREAVRLLFKSPRHEGLWDGVLTARIGIWMIRCEEEGLDSPPLVWEEGSMSGTSSPDNGNKRRSKSWEKLIYTVPSPVEKGTVTKEWIVPEQNRMRLLPATFHIPERHIKVKCQRTLPDRDGNRERRETVIAW